MSDVKFIDASEWQILPWYSTGGTRAKRVLLHSEDWSEWYFKCSEKKLGKDGKPDKYYKYEFWSEVIAYQVGTFLEIKTLRYDPGINNGEIGCISPLMINNETEDLIEMGRFMTSLNPDFIPKDTKTRHEYTFQLLVDALDAYKLTEYLPVYLETLLFDAIIGNTDRHQENWAFIGKRGFVAQALTEIEQDVKVVGFKRLPMFFRWLFKRIFNHEKTQLNTQAEQMKLYFTKIKGMAPMYDNGSSLGRELSDERVEELLANEQALNRYVENGKCEVHWDNKKLTHFQFIENLLKSSYLQQVQQAGAFIRAWDDEQIKQIVNTIDEKVPADWHSYCIPENRKRLITKLLLLRSQKLKSLLGNGRI